MFKLPKEADNWFSYIRKDLKLDFDVYYFCLMAGLAKGEKEVNSQTRDLINRFPQEYKAESRIIISLFLKNELDKMGISLGDRKQVHETIRNYIDHSSPSFLSELGQKEINKYCNGGIVVLKTFFDDKPRTIEAFIIKFTKIIEKIM